MVLVAAETLTVPFNLGLQARNKLDLESIGSCKYGIKWHLQKQSDRSSGFGVWNNFFSLVDNHNGKAMTNFNHNGNLNLGSVLTMTHIFSRVYCCNYCQGFTQFYRYG